MRIGRRTVAKVFARLKFQHVVMSVKMLPNFRFRSEFSDTSLHNFRLSGPTRSGRRKKCKNAFIHAEERRGIVQFMRSCINLRKGFRLSNVTCSPRWDRKAANARTDVIEDGRHYTHAPLPSFSRFSTFSY